MEIIIDGHLKGAAPRLALGALLAPVEVTKHDPSLWSEIDTRIEAILASIKLEAVCDLPQIKAIRDAYRSLGKDPSRYRASQEALFRSSNTNRMKNGTSKRETPHRSEAIL